MANLSIIEEVTLFPSISVAFSFRSTDGARSVYSSGTHDVLIMVVYGTIMGCR